MRRMSPVPTILVFDSGLGGLTVYREIVRARPDAALVYAADDAFFPYGGRDEAALVERVLALVMAGRYDAAGRELYGVLLQQLPQTIILSVDRRGVLRDFHPRAVELKIVAAQAQPHAALAAAPA